MMSAPDTIGSAQVEGTREGKGDKNAKTKKKVNPNHKRPKNAETRGRKKASQKNSQRERGKPRSECRQRNR